MNIEQLKQRLASQVTEVDGFYLCKLCASDGYEYSKRFADIPAEADFEQTIDAYTWLLSKCVVTPDGKPKLDSDEGRELLRRLDARTMQRLAEAAIAWNIGDAKKN